MAMERPWITEDQSCEVRGRRRVNVRRGSQPRGASAPSSGHGPSRLEVVFLFARGPGGLHPAPGPCFFRGRGSEAQSGRGTEASQRGGLLPLPAPGLVSTWPARALFIGREMARLSDSVCEWRDCRAEPTIGYRGAWLCSRHWCRLAQAIDAGTPALTVIRRHFRCAGGGMELSEMEAPPGRLEETEPRRHEDTKKGEET